MAKANYNNGLANEKQLGTNWEGMKQARDE
jgi:hypothetical protein